MRPKSAEVLYSTLRFTPRRPVETRWNSLFDAFVDIRCLMDKNSDVFTYLEVSPLSANDMTYIKEFIQCMQPIADALDIMQGEKYYYFGITIPTLVALRRKLQILTETHFIYCSLIVQTLLSSVSTRFTDSFAFTSPGSIEAGIAALSHPQFRKKWLTCISPESQSEILNAFTNAVIHLSEFSSEEKSHLTPSSSESITSDFFDFGEGSTFEESTNRTRAELEILHFFNDANQHLNILHNYPNIKQDFLKYNTALPSSAAVERLFSYATMTNMPKSNRLSDRNFETRVLLKANMQFCKS